MKKFFLTTSLLGILFFSCQEKNGEKQIIEKDTIVTINTEIKGELWAESIRTQADIIKPAEWSEEDWKSVNKSLDNKKIVATLLNAVLTGKQKAYSVVDDTTILSIDEIKNIVTNKAGDKNPVDVIDNIRIQESWYFDTISFSMSKKVIAICPCKKHYGENGDFQGYEPMFWIRTNQ